MPYLAYIEDEIEEPPEPFFEWFTAETPDPAAIVTGAAVVERNRFWAYLATPAVEDFESYTISLTPQALSGVFNGITYQIIQTTTYLSDDDEVLVFEDGLQIQSRTDLGRFNTTPSGLKYAQGNLNTGELDIGPIPVGMKSVYMTFSPSIAFCGFYALDFGDVFAQGIRVQITDDDDIVYTYDLTEFARDTGNLRFIGFIDTTGRTYKKLEILFIPDSYALSFDDIIGFDDLVFGTVAELL